MPAPKSKAQLEKEENELISSFSNDVSVGSSGSLLVNALLAAATPLYVFIRVQQVDFASAWHVMTAATLITAWVLQFIYQKGRNNLRNKIANEIHTGVSKEVMGSLSASEKKSLSSQDKNDKILRRQNTIADSSAVQTAVYTTNLVYFIFLMISSFFVFGTWEPLSNYLGSVILTVGAIFAVAYFEKKN